MQVREAGLLRKSVSFYIPSLIFAFGGYFATGWAIVSLTDYGLLALACLGFAFFSVQIAGLMHDSGHRAISDSTLVNNLVGLLTSGAIAMVFSNWMERHNTHHSNSNRVGKDPDLEIPLIATSVAMYERKRGIQRLLTPYQAYYYYPLGAIVGLSNRLGTITFFFRNHSSWQNLWQFVAYATGIAILFVAPFLMFPLDKALFVFTVVHLAAGVYMANCFAPNHKGMPQLDQDEAMSYFEQQVVTSRNVRGGFLTDLLLVGLNYQIEHHLFPYCPRNKLRQVQPYVKRMCGELGVPYTEVSIVETNRAILRQMQQVSREATPAMSPR
jgi:fatty acid desaturase